MLLSRTGPRPGSRRGRRPRRAIYFTLGLAGWWSSTSSASAADIYKANNGTTLNTAGSWIGGTTPGASDVAVWDSNFTFSSTQGTIGGNLSFGGIRIANPTVNISIGPVTLANLTLGSSGIDMTAAAADLTIGANVTLASTQNWNVASGRTLNMSGAFLAGANDLTLNSGGQSGSILFSNATNVFNSLTLAGGLANFTTNTINGSLTLTGGTMQMIGTSTGTGPVTIGSAATLRVGNFGTTGLINRNITNNGAFEFAHTTTTTYSANMTGSGTVTILGFGTAAGQSAIFSGNNSYTGATTVTNNSLLSLTFTTTSAGNNILNNGLTAEQVSTGSGSGLVLSGGANLSVTGVTTGTTTNRQDFNGLTLEAGTSTISATSTSSRTVFVNLNAITRNTGSTLNFTTSVATGAANITTNTTNAGGILGGWATIRGLDWAVSNGNASAITALGSTDAGWSVGTNTLVPGAGLTGVSGATNSVRFSTGSGCVSLGGSASITSGGILAATSVAADVAITGASLTAGTSDIPNELFLQQFSTTANLTIGSNIVDNGAGATTLVKSGPGLAILTGTNTYTGATYVTGGTLRVASNAQLGDTTVAVPLYLINGTLQTAGTFALENGGVGRLINLAGANNAINVTSGNTLTLNGVISGLAHLAKTGTGNMVIGANNTFTGSFAINGGVVTVNTLANGGLSSPLGASTNTAANFLIDGATLRYTGSGSSTDRTLTVGAGGATLDSAGTGPLIFSRDSSMGMSGTGNRTLTLTGTTDGTLSPRFPNPTGGLTYLLKTGAGTWSLASGSNGFTGVVTILEGVLSTTSLPDDAADTASSLGAGTGPFGVSAARIVIAGGTLRTSGVVATQTLFTIGAGNAILEATAAANFVSTGLIAFDGAGTRSLTLGGTGVAVARLTPTLGDNGACATSLTKTGTNVWLLAGTNTFTGPVTINQGSLAVANLTNGLAPSPLGCSSSAASSIIIDGGFLRYAPLTGTGDTTDRLFTLGAGNGGVEASGNAVQPVVFGNTGAIAFGGAGSRILTLGGTGTAENVFHPLISDNGGDATNLIKNGAGTWLLPRVLDYTGTTGVQAGILALVGGDNRLPTSANLTLGTPLAATVGTLQLGNVSGPSNQTISGLQVTGTGITNRVVGGAAAISTLTANIASGDTVFAGILGGIGANNNNLALTKTGSGTLTLSLTTSIYVGPTTILAGTLSVATVGNGLAASSALGSSSSAASNLVINGGTLRITTGSSTATDRLFSIGAGPTGATIESNTTAGAITFFNAGSVGFVGNGSRTLTLTGTSTFLNSIAPVIGDQDATNITRILKTGLGNWTLAGTNTYTGTTTIREGVLSISAVQDGGVASPIGAATAAASNLVLDGGTFRVVTGSSTTNRLFTLTEAGGTINYNPAGTLLFSNTGSLAMPTGSSRTLTFTPISSTGIITFLPNIEDAIGGCITSVLKNGAGTLNANSTSTYTGTTTITAGILSIPNLTDGGSPSGIGSSSSAASNLIIDGANFRYTGTTAASTDRLFTVGANGATISTTGTASISYINTGAIAFLGSGPRTLTLTPASSSPMLFAPLIGDGAGGPTSLVKTGSGPILTLTNSNTYSGTTTILAGTVILALGDNRLPVTTPVTLGCSTAAGFLQLGNASGAISQTITGLLTNGTAVTNRVGGGNATLSTLTLNITSGTNVFNGVLGGTGNQVNFAVIKEGAGTFTLTGTASSYIGGTTLRQGTFQFGTVAPWAATGNLTLAGGTLNTAGLSVISGNLALTDIGSEIDLMPSIDHTLTFNGATITYTGGSLHITGWAGSVGSAGDDGRLLFPNLTGSPNSVNASFLSSVQFYSDSAGTIPIGSGATFIGTAGSYELVAAVPEPTSILTFAGVGLSLVGYVRRRRSIR